MTATSGICHQAEDPALPPEGLRLNKAKSGHENLVSQAVWNRDESLILTSSSYDNTVRMWDAQTGAERFAVAGTQATWNKDETLLLVTNGNTVEEYYTQMKDLLKVACERAQRNMTRAEWRRFMGDEPYRATCDNLPIEKEE